MQSQQGKSGAVLSPAQMLKLPASLELVYLAEGAANIVYRINSSQGSIETANESSKCTYAGKLLRLRKNNTSSTPYIDITRKFNAQIRTLFRDDELVGQDLVELPKGLTTLCNEKLKEDELCNRRPKKRHGMYLCTEERFGLLIMDMTAAPDSGATLWELKPKWLTQSPSAPPNAQRCRTCALREKRNFEANQKTIKGGREHHAKKAFCPFNLVSDDPKDLLAALKTINDTPDAHRVAAFMHRHPTLLKLRDRQRQMNMVGLAGVDATNEERAISMTLRDCTMFIKVPRQANEPFDLRLGDLDFKSGGGGKLEYWEETETQLIEEGWYLGTHASQADSSCVLQRKPAV